MDNHSKLPFVMWPDNEEEQKNALANSEQLAEFQAYRSHILPHKYTPKYHFWSPDGKLNDPNGLCFFNGKYHLFYQQYPHADPRQHWGHAVSDDMVHWKDLPTAIYPDPEYAVYSGNTLVENDGVIAMYHGFPIGNMVAKSTDPLLLNWQKLTNDAVIRWEEGVPYGVYDPFLWREDNGYYSLSGVSKKTVYGKRMSEQLFYSQDLIHWVYLGELIDNNPFMTIGDDGACPYFIPMKDDRYLLFHFSHSSGPHILSGIYNKITHKFIPDHHMKLSCNLPWIGSFTAPCVISDRAGGAYCIFNCSEGRSADANYPREGMMSMMYHVTLDANNVPVISPLKQYDSLHQELLCDSSFTAEHGEHLKLPAQGKALDIQMTMDLSGATGFELEVFASQRERTVIRFVQRNEHPYAYVTVDAVNASLDPTQIGKAPETIDVPIMDEARRLDIRILIDNCMIEVFCQGRIIFNLAYPTLPESDGIYLSGVGGTARCKKAKVWSMKQIY